MDQKQREDWIVQLKWQAQGMYDAAALLARVYGAKTEMYQDLIRTKAEGTEELMKRVQSQTDVKHATETKDGN